MRFSEVFDRTRSQDQGTYARSSPRNVYVHPFRLIPFLRAPSKLACIYSHQHRPCHGGHRNGLMPRQQPIVLCLRSRARSGGRQNERAKIRLGNSELRTIGACVYIVLICNPLMYVECTYIYLHIYVYTNIILRMLIFVSNGKIQSIYIYSIYTIELIRKSYFQEEFLEKFKSTITVCILYDM